MSRNSMGSQIQKKRIEASADVKKNCLQSKIYSLVHGLLRSSNVPTDSRQENCAREHEREMAEKPSGLRKSVALNNFLSVCKAKNTCKLIQPTRKEITLHCQIKFQQFLM